MRDGDEESRSESQLSEKPDEKKNTGKEKCKSFHKYRKTLAELVDESDL